jgi:hypothetical protein
MYVMNSWSVLCASFLVAKAAHALLAAATRDQVETDVDNELPRAAIANVSPHEALLGQLDAVTVDRKKMDRGEPPDSASPASRCPRRTAVAAAPSACSRSRSRRSVGRSHQTGIARVAESVVGSLILVLYGGVEVLAGGLVLADVITPSGPVDEHALRWHVFVWDLWFLVWGVALGIAAWRYARRGRTPTG